MTLADTPSSPVDEATVRGTVDFAVAPELVEAHKARVERNIMRYVRGVMIFIWLLGAFMLTIAVSDTVSMFNAGTPILAVVDVIPLALAVLLGIAGYKVYRASRVPVYWAQTVYEPSGFMVHETCEFLELQTVPEATRDQARRATLAFPGLALVVEKYAGDPVVSLRLPDGTLVAIGGYWHRRRTINFDRYAK